jgi:DNA polymerase
MITWVVIDFETASACDLKKCGAWRYAEDVTTEILCLAYARDLKTTGLWKPGDEPGELLDLVNDPNVWFVAHSAQFEKAIWRNIMVPMFGWPDIPNNRWHDTQAACAMKVIPQDLDLALTVLRLPYEKDMEGRAITLAMSKLNRKGYYDRDPEKLNRVYSYCRDDTSGEVAVHGRLGWLPPKERTVWLLNQRVNERGVRLDLEYIRNCQRIVDLASAPLLVEFAKLTGGLKPSQGEKFLSWCRIHGANLPNLQKETLASVLGGSIDDGEEVDSFGGEADEGVEEGIFAPLPVHVHRALFIRQLIGSASVKKLARMEAVVCADGRARGLLQYHGTGPGRSAGRLLQPQNFPRGTILLGKEPPPVDLMVEVLMTGDPDYVAAMLGPPVECVVSGLRHSLISDTGRVYVSGDYAGIQARLVLSVAGQHDKVALMASGADVYCDMGSQIHKRTITKKDKAERQDGKNSVLGLGFQMGARKFFDKYCKGRTLEFAEHVVRVYRKEWAPRVPYVWYGLEEAAVKAVWDRTPQEAYGVEYRMEDGWLSARLPSGRKMWYFNPRPIRKAMPYDRDVVKPAFTYQARKMGVWRTINAFGGQLTENVVMGIERDIMTHGMLKLEKNGFPIVLEVHDEIVAEPLAADADEKAFAQIMVDVEPWVKHLQVPIATETWVGDRYRK